MKKQKKIVLAYSGGLDTSVILKWLQEKYNAEVIAYTADIGQRINKKKIIKNAKKLGVKKIIIENFTFIIDNLADQRAQWDMFADDVMGGLSTGKLSELKEGEVSFYRLEGDVSTANNGGFIQFRTSTKLKGTAYEGIKIKVRGNNNKYFIHLRTGATVFPWDYYDSSFEATSEWKNITLPFTSFKKSSRLLPKKVKSSKIKSIGLVAYGKEFQAELDLASIELY